VIFNKYILSDIKQSKMAPHLLTDIHGVTYHGLTH